MGKLTKIQVIVIGVVVTLIVGVGMFFLLIRPRAQQLNELETKLQEREAVAARKPQAEKDLQRAKLENLQARLDYRHYEVTKMPAVSFSDRTEGMIAMWRERSEVLGPMVEHWPRKFGVDLLNDIPIPPASSDPNSYADGLIRIPIGPISVRGDYHSILRHLKGWNKFGRLVQVEPMSLSGVSPVLTATYNATILIFPRGKIGPNVAMAAAGQQGGAAATSASASPPPLPMPPAGGQAAPGAPNAGPVMP